MTTNSQLLTTEHKNQKQKLSKQLQQEKSQKWRSHGGLSVGRRRGKNGGKGTEYKKYKW